MTNNGVAVGVLVLFPGVVEDRPQQAHGVIRPGMAAFAERSVAQLHQVFGDFNERLVLPVGKRPIEGATVIMDRGLAQVLAGSQVILERHARVVPRNGPGLAFGERVLAGGDFTEKRHGLPAGLFDGQVAVTAQGDPLDLAVDALLGNKGLCPATGDPQAEAGNDAIPEKRLGGAPIGLDRGQFDTIDEAFGDAHGVAGIPD